MSQTWNEQNIANEILRRYYAKKPLHYTGVAEDYLSLLRAATRCFGTWEAAITFAGLDYAEIRLYKVWTRARIIARIRELHTQGADLSWRYISSHVDPQMAAAAVKKIHFGSWRRALEAAGLDYDTIRRYRDWDSERVLKSVRERHQKGKSLNAKNMQRQDITLLTAARRRYPSWPHALSAAGLDYEKIVLRASSKCQIKPKDAPAKTRAKTVAKPTFAEPTAKKSAAQKPAAQKSTAKASAAKASAAKASAANAKKRTAKTLK